MPSHDKEQLARPSVHPHSNKDKGDKIAIVGLAALYPDAPNVDTFWQNLLQKKDVRSQLSKYKLNANVDEYKGLQGQNDRFYCDKGSYINQFDFDTCGYQLDEKYLLNLDDSAKWALNTCRQALVDANIDLTPAQLLRTGVVMGALSFPTRQSNTLFLPLYHRVVEKALQTRFGVQGESGFRLSAFTEHWGSTPQETDIEGAAYCDQAQLVAKALGLGGVHFNLDAACASSVYSLKLACDYLIQRKADVMLAAAVSGADPFVINMGFSIFHAYPDNDVSVPFDPRSQGLFAGEGAGVLVLKRLNDAIQNNDHIYAVVDGVGLSNDGKGQFVLSPKSQGQIAAYERAYQESGINPDNVEVIECHATGTPLGDKVELTSMENFFSDKLKGTSAPFIGSVKSNLGHLLTVAGMPGIMKMIYSMDTGKLPPSIHIEHAMSSPNGLFGLHTLPREVIDWPDKQGKKVPNQRYAGVSVFGFGGCNAHLVLSSFNHNQLAEDTDNEAVMLERAHLQDVVAHGINHDPFCLTITGVSAHFGPLNSIQALNQVIENNHDGFIELPKQRWKGLEKHADILAEFGLQSVPKGAYIDSFELDFLRFKLPPNEDDRLIPQQLLLMKIADEAIRDAGLKSGQHVAVLVAMETELELHQFRGRVNLHSQLKQSLQQQGITLTEEEYQALEAMSMESILPAAKLNQYTSFIGNIMASRVASLWDFSGPAFTISAAEHSVARCLDVAQNLLANTDDKDPLQAVVIAAVDLSGCIEKVYSTNQIQPVSVKPHSIKSKKEASDAALGSWNVGEGAGAIVVQPSNGEQSSKGYADIPKISASGMGHDLTHSIDGFVNASTPIMLIETNMAPCRETQALYSAFDELMARFPQAKHTQASGIVGHTFAAAGMASLLNSLFQLPASVREAEHFKVRGLVASMTKDEQSLFFLTQSQAQQHELQQRLTQDLTQVICANSEQKIPQLIKKVTLGGKDIFDFILNSPLEKEAAIKDKLTLLNLTVSSSGQKYVSNIAMLIEAHKHRSVVAVNEVKSMKRCVGETHSIVGSSQNSDNRQGVDANIPQSIIPLHLQQQDMFQDVHSTFLKGRHLGLTLREQQLRLKYHQLRTDKKEEMESEVANDDLQNMTLNNVSTDAIKLEIYEQNQVPSSCIEFHQDEKSCIWDYKDLQEYAEGDIANVFGPDYAIIDSYARRVRLPTTDYLLVSRVTKLDAKIHEFKPSSMTTEYDIPEDAPYLLDGQILWAVAVESGQCDLMLISYLGIDFENKGERVYRLLDCSLTFLADLPRAGDTLRYDIKINHFARNGDTLLFFFSYECFVDDVMILKMDDGCAGFFTDEELAEGKGVIRTEAELEVRKQALKEPRPTVNPLLNCQKRQFSKEDISQLSQANLAGCFGESHDIKGAVQTSLSFTSKQFLMIESVSQVELNGGAWGLGLIEAHKQLAPDHWYFPCHFKDDPVMAGSLMAEGCGQLLQFYMLYLGMHTLTKKGRFQPLTQLTQKVRCRGQVLPQSGQLTYRMEITDIGFGPEPFAKANVDILLNGKVVVDFRDLGVVLKEEEVCRRYLGHQHLLSAKNDNANINAPLMTKVSDFEAQSNKGVIPFKHVPAPLMPDYPNQQPNTLPFTPYHLFEFATGNIEKCFGEDFSVYRHRISPRTPCGDLQLTTRVIDIKGKRGELNAGASCLAEYEVPADAWYFKANNHPSKMPYAILMEISLQPNGFISGYVGTTLSFIDEDLFFRNLDGKGSLLCDVDLRGKTIQNRSKLISTVVAGANIIQRFTFELSCDDEIFYQGEAAFGYFKEEALTHQLGLDKGDITEAWHHQAQVKPDHQINLLDKNSRYFCGSNSQPYFRLAGGQLNFIDQVDIVEKGGHQGLGYVFAKRTIDPSDWFFQCHFHQDPVMPGSLGVEAIIELMQVYAINQDLGADFINPKLNHILSDIEWKYRGQINPLNTHMSVDVHITAIKDEVGKKIIIGNANLSKDGLRIYEVKNIAICIEEA